MEKLEDFAEWFVPPAAISVSPEGDFYLSSKAMAGIYCHHGPFACHSFCAPSNRRQNHILWRSHLIKHHLIKHHQQKGIKSQILTWWKNYWQLEKQLRTVSFWLSPIRKEVVIFSSGSAYRQQPRHLLTRMRFSDMFKTLKSFTSWKFHKSHWLENCCKRDKMKNVSDWNGTAVHFEWGKRDLEDTEHGKRSWGFLFRHCVYKW